MKKTNYVTEEPLGCGPSPRKADVQHKETPFERRRGVSRVESRHGFSQIHVTNLTGNVTEGRLKVLKAVSAVDTSIDFLKFTPTGLSFLVEGARTAQVKEALDACGVENLVREGRSIVLVFAVNMRDEEGLIASIMKTAIASGVQVDHVGDGHDRMLMVVQTGDANTLAKVLEKSLSEAAQ